MNLESENPFEVLGVQEDDDPRTIKRAYVLAIKKYRPETNPDEFRKIRECYEFAVSQTPVSDSLATMDAGANTEDRSDSELPSETTSCGRSVEERLARLESALEEFDPEELKAVLDDEELQILCREDPDVEDLVSHALRCLAWPELAAAQELARAYGFLSAASMVGTDILGHPIKQTEQWDLLGLDAVLEFYKLANFRGFDLKILKILRDVLNPAWDEGDAEDIEWLIRSSSEVDRIARRVAENFPALHAHWYTFLPYNFEYYESPLEALSTDEESLLDSELRALGNWVWVRLAMWLWLPLIVVGIVTGGVGLGFLLFILYLAIPTFLRGHNLYELRLRKSLLPLAVEYGFGSTVILAWARRRLSIFGGTSYVASLEDDHALDLVAAVFSRCRRFQSRE